MGFGSATIRGPGDVGSSSPAPSASQDRPSSGSASSSYNQVQEQSGPRVVEPETESLTGKVRAATEQAVRDALNAGLGRAAALRARDAAKAAVLNRAIRQGSGSVEEWNRLSSELNAGSTPLMVDARRAGLVDEFGRPAVSAAPTANVTRSAPLNQLQPASVPRNDLRARAAQGVRDIASRYRLRDITTAAAELVTAPVPFLSEERRDRIVDSVGDVTDRITERVPAAERPLETAVDAVQGAVRRTGEYLESNPAVASGLESALTWSPAGAGVAMTGSLWGPTVDAGLETYYGEPGELTLRAETTLMRPDNPFGYLARGADRLSGGIEGLGRRGQGWVGSSLNPFLTGEVSEFLGFGVPAIPDDTVSFLRGATTDNLADFPQLFVGVPARVGARMGEQLNQNGARANLLEPIGWAAGSLVGGMARYAREDPYAMAGGLIVPGIVDVGVEIVDPIVGGYVATAGKTYVPVSDVARFDIARAAESGELFRSGSDVNKFPTMRGSVNEAIALLESARGRYPNSELFGPDTAVGVHVTPKRFTSEWKSQRGDSESPGLYVGPNASLWFSKIGGADVSFIPHIPKIFDVGRVRPSIMFTEADSYVRVGIPDRTAANEFILNSPKTNFYTTHKMEYGLERGASREPEAVLPPGARAKQIESEYYTTVRRPFTIMGMQSLFGMPLSHELRIPIDAASVIRDEPSVPAVVEPELFETSDDSLFFSGETEESGGLTWPIGSNMDLQAGRPGRPEWGGLFEQGETFLLTEGSAERKTRRSDYVDRSFERSQSELSMIENELFETERGLFSDANVEANWIEEQVNQQYDLFQQNRPSKSIRNAARKTNPRRQSGEYEFGFGMSEMGLFRENVPEPDYYYEVPRSELFGSERYGSERRDYGDGERYSPPSSKRTGAYSRGYFADAVPEIPLLREPELELLGRDELFEPARGKRRREDREVNPIFDLIQFLDSAGAPAPRKSGRKKKR